MFHQGNLQSGISLAIQEQKLVGILVRDDGAESATWEDEWLKSGWIANLLEQTAVLLRLEAGSAEAGFLSAFCTISSTPTFVVIQNGQLKEQLSAGITQDEFVNRVRKVLGASPIPGSSQTPTESPQTSSTPRQTSSVPATTTSTPPVVNTPQIPPPTPAPARTPARAPASPPPPTTKDKGKQKAAPSQINAQTSAAQQAARDALRKKKREEKEDLERIQARIEADKAERKAQAEARKAEREREKQSQQASETTQASQFTTRSTKGSQAKQVNLSVRLFDGRTVRSTFPRTATLEKDVRPWIDREAAAAAAASENPSQKQPPYFFKQILAPLPSRELSAGDEAETLGDIDLAPSATLFLVPVKGYTEAYSGGSGGGIVYGATGNVMGLVGGAFNLAGSVLGYVGSTVSSVLGGGGSGDAGAAQSGGASASGQSLGSSQPQSQSQPDSSSGGAGAASIRVRTLADQRAREGQSPNFYNGNQLSYAPRDEGGDDDGASSRRRND